MPVPRSPGRPVVDGRGRCAYSAPQALRKDATLILGISASSCSSALAPLALVAFAIAQEQQPPSGAPRTVPPALAIASQARAKRPADLVLALRHEPKPDAGGCAKGDACDAAAHWLVELQVSPIGSNAAKKPIVLAMTQTAELGKELRAGAAPKAREAGAQSLSEATLSIRVSARTPWALVQGLLGAVAAAGIYRVGFAVVSPGAVAVEQDLAMPLPIAAAEVAAVKSAPREEIRVTMSWDTAREETVIRFGRLEMPGGAAGEAKLRTLLAEVARDWQRLGRDEVPGIVDAAGRVPWQAVVGVIDACRAAGVKNVQFAEGR